MPGRFRVCARRNGKIRPIGPIGPISPISLSPTFFISCFLLDNRESRDILQNRMRFTRVDSAERNGISAYDRMERKKN